MIKYVPLYVYFNYFLIINNFFYNIKEIIAIY